MKKQFIVDTLQVAQVPIGSLSKKTIEKLRRHASYVDTDKTLNEFIVSVETIGEVANKQWKEKKELNMLFMDVKAFQYVVFIKTANPKPL